MGSPLVTRRQLRGAADDVIAETAPRRPADERFAAQPERIPIQHMRALRAAVAGSVDIVVDRRWTFR